MSAFRLCACLFALAACGPVEPRSGVPSLDGGYVLLPDGGSPCRGNNDGVVSRDEVFFVAGVQVRYRVNPAGTTVSVDLRGETRGDGTHVWDFSDPAGEVTSLTLEAVEGRWFAAEFSTAQYAARLDPRSPLLGVYRTTAQGVDLLGVVGESEADGTRLRYETPIPILRFPLALGSAWSAQSLVIDGRIQHLPYASRDTYQIAVDATGELRLGILSFPRTVRVRVELGQQFPAGPGNHRIQYLWLTECYGEVARVTSRDGEIDPDFRQATEFRRLSL
jgi:hypothetical protein